MQYSLLIYQTPRQFADRNDPAQGGASNAAFGSYVQSLHGAGVLVTTLGIDPPELAAAARRSSGALSIQHGPYANGEEQLGGLCVIEVPDFDAALSWAQRAPFDHCAAVEVRPTRVVNLS